MLSSELGRPVANTVQPNSGINHTLTTSEISYLEHLNKKFFLAYMDLGILAIAGYASGVSDRFSRVNQNRALNQVQNTNVIFCL